MPIKLLYAFVNYAFFAACCASAMVVQSFFFLQLPVNIFVVGFVFFATICSYNFHFLVAKYTQLHLRISFATLGLNAHVYSMLMAVIGMCIIFPYSKLPFYTILFSLVCTGLYSLPLLPFNAIALLKKFGYVKTFLLAFTWAYVTVYLPAASSNISISEIAYWMVHRFVFMLILCIIFDTRDIETDTIKGLHSLATDIPKKAIHTFVVLLLMASVVLNFYGCSFYTSAKQLLGVQAVVVCTAVVYVVSLKKRGYLFYYCIVDGLMIVSAIVSTLASI